MARSPQPIQELVGPVFREHRRQDHVTLAALQQRWAELVGPGLAERTWPTRLQQGLLWITAPDSSWAYQLQFLKQDLLSGIRAGFDSGPGVRVTDLRFKVGKLPEPAASATTVSTGAPSAAAAPEAPAAPELARAAGSIADPTLRGAFLRAMTKQARRTSGKG